jgi:hypothetical protein
LRLPFRHERNGTFKGHICVTQEKKQELSTPSTGQVDKFKAMAKELDADESEDGFNTALKKISATELASKAKGR